MPIKYFKLFLDHHAMVSLVLHTCYGSGVTVICNNVLY
jgi:hypothetical protein